MVRRRRSGEGILSGRDALRKVDMVIADARGALTAALDTVDTQARRSAEIQREQLEAYRGLADVRIDLIQKRHNGADLQGIDRRAAELMAEHETFVERESGRLDALVAEIVQFETEREVQAKKLDLAVKAWEDKTTEIVASLEDDGDYIALAEAVARAGSVSERAERKLELARSDREEKGAPYDEDPLFSYLWDRQFRTPEYKAGPFARFFDGWVGRLCGYDKAHLNYARLVELPDRLAEHVERVEQLEQQANDKLAEAEAKALDTGGANELHRKAEVERKKLDQLDLKIEQSEAAHLAKARAHQDALQARTGPAEEARKVIEQELRKASFPDLRVLAAQTITMADDELVDGLVKLRAEEMQIDLSTVENASLPERRRWELKKLEALRSKFKRAGFDSARITFQTAALDEAVDDLLGGDRGVDKVIKRLAKGIRRLDRGRTGKHRRRHDRRRRSSGFEQVLGDVAWEIAREAMRGDGGFDIGDLGGGSRRRGGSSRRSPSRRTGRRTGGGSNRYSSGRKRGGFKTRDKF